VQAFWRLLVSASLEDAVCYPRSSFDRRSDLARLVLLSDRSPRDALPAVEAIGLDVKVEPLGVDSLAHLPDIAPEAIVVDAAENPAHAHGILLALAAAGARLPVAVIVERGDLDTFGWHEVADELLYPGAPEAEVRVRLAMLRRRIGVAPEASIRLGSCAINSDTYQVTVDGRPLDLTYKEFELLKFLAQHPGRVFTRGALLREVWGYDFYGGTRTVDVHIRRLRAKLGPEHEHLIETVRGVGYRAATVEE
jgi:DNA-binding response OmpR family regulator